MIMELLLLDLPQFNMADKEDMVIETGIMIGQGMIAQGTQGQCLKEGNLMIARDPCKETEETMLLSRTMVHQVIGGILVLLGRLETLVMPIRE